MRKWLITVLTLLLILFMASSADASTPKRLAGSDRYSTATAIAQEGWQQSDYAILANGENYPDALSAAPLAKKYDAPILLVNSSIPDTTKQILINLKVKNVFIIGGIGVIPIAIEEQLKLMNINTVRISGQDRYETAIKVAEQLGSPSEVFVATGEDYPDALSIAPIASVKQEPIILVPKDYLPDSVKNYITSGHIASTYVMGDTDIIDDSVVKQFHNVERNKGVDRYVRNINANVHFPFASKDICVASGEGFADALTGVAMAAKKEIPIVLTNNNPSELTRIFTVINLNMANTTKGIPYILGGTSVLSDATVNSLFDLPSAGQQANASKPSSPTNLTAWAISSSDISIQWDSVENADYYYVYYSNDGNSFYKTVDKDNNQIKYQRSPNSSFTLTGNPANFTAYFKVTAVKNGVESDYSNVANATTNSSTQADLTTKDIVIHGPLKLIADDSKHTYLGKLATNKFDSESVFNEFGTYGSKFSSKSIYNEFGTYGGDFGLYSPFNKFSLSPPLIVDADGNIVGRLSVNSAVIGAISPYVIYDLLEKLGL